MVVFVLALSFGEKCLWCRLNFLTKWKDAAALSRMLARKHEKCDNCLRLIFLINIAIILAHRKENLIITRML